MLQVSSHALFGRRFVRHLVRLTRVYWTSPDAARGGLLFALAAALELGTVYGNVLLSDAQRLIFDALQSKQMTTLSQAFGIFLGLALSFVLISAYRVYVRQVLEIRWRQWLTSHVSVHPSGVRPVAATGKRTAIASPFTDFIAQWRTEEGTDGRGEDRRF